MPPHAFSAAAIERVLNRAVSLSSFRSAMDTKLVSSSTGSFDHLVGAGLRDISHQDLAVSRRVHTSSPSLKTAAFFLENKQGSVSARALSLRCSSRSSSFTRRRSANPEALPQHWSHAARPDPLSHPVSRHPAPPDTGPARGSRRCVSPHPSLQLRRLLAVAPPLS